MKNYGKILKIEANIRRKKKGGENDRVYKKNEKI